MPLTITLSTPPAPLDSPRIQSPLKLVVPKEPRPQLLQSSFGRTDAERADILGCKNGFVDTVIAAYNGHHPLILRPDDVWITILSQFNLYVNAHAEDLRAHFVAHEGKRELVILGGGNRFTADFDVMAQQMTSAIQRNVVDPDLQEWILPKFSTTTSNDTTICAVMMMSTLKAYFAYEFRLRCGLPSVTLEGTKEDWSTILERIDKLPSFGKEPADFAALLRPIISRFVRAFEGDVDHAFWGRICHQFTLGSGPRYLSGWVTAFSVWNKDGKWNNSKAEEVKIHSYGDEDARTSGLDLDGVVYPVLVGEDVPTATCQVDVKLDDNGTIFQCEMVAGHIGSQVQLGTHLAPLPAWFMLIKA